MMFLLILNLVLLVVGCLMDIFTAIIVVVPLIVPIAREFGISLNTLRLRALRIRAKLQTCIKKCLEVSAGSPFGRRLGQGTSANGRLC